MSRETILILGAGTYQVPLIRACRARGLQTVVATIDGPYPGIVEADTVSFTDIVDHQAVLSLAQEQQCRAVLTCGSDVAMPAAGHVCDQLHLVGPSMDAALLASDKRLMKQAFVAHAVRTAAYHIVREDADLENFMMQGHCPAILKIPCSSGSRGVITVADVDEARAACAALMRDSQQSEILIEELLVGEEFGAQAAVVDGVVQFLLPHGDVLWQGDSAVPIGHWVPFHLAQNILDDLAEQVRRSVAALQIDNCALNVDCMLVGDRVYILEIGARAGGTCLPELVSYYYGIDYYDYLIDIALGRKPHWESAQQCPCANLLLTATQAGQLQDLPNFSTHLGDRLIAEHFDYALGAAVPAFRHGPDRLGHVIFSGESEDALRKTLAELSAYCRIEPNV